MTLGRWMAEASRHQLLCDKVLINRSKIDIRTLEKQVPHDIHAGKIREQPHVAQEQLEIR